jgi:hypothetical protein
MIFASKIGIILDLVAEGRLRSALGEALNVGSICCVAI